MSIAFWSRNKIAYFLPTDEIEQIAANGNYARLFTIRGEFAIRTTMDLYKSNSTRHCSDASAGARLCEFPQFNSLSFRVEGTTSCAYVPEVRLHAPRGTEAW